MRYEEISVECEGTLDEERTFTDYLLRNQYLQELYDESLADGVTLKVYIQTHYHDPSQEECACAQYSASHKPDFVFPDDDPPGSSAA